MAFDDGTGRAPPKEVTTPTYVSGNALLMAGAVGGLIAGAVFAVAMMVVAAVTGMGLLAPWAMFASVVLGQGVLQAPTVGTFIVGFLVHFALSAMFGAIWGGITRAVPLGIRTSYGSHTAAAAIYGLLLYLVNVQLVARVLYPWFLSLDPFTSLVLHSLAFGLPLGLFMVWQIRTPVLLGSRPRKQSV